MLIVARVDIQGVAVGLAPLNEAVQEPVPLMLHTADALDDF